MPYSRKLLREILATLIKHWGVAEVRHELDQMPDRQEEPSSESAQGDALAPSLKARRKPTPRQIVARYDMPDRIREDALHLASMYEAKAFLPTIADVRHFLETRGREPGSVKNRDQAFVKVIDVVLGMAPEAIRQLRNSAVHGRPSRLGPISDAIGAAGDTMRRRG